MATAENNSTPAITTATEQPPREINESTDITTLTDAEIRLLNERAELGAMKVQEERPLVSFPTPLSHLATEYSDDSQESVNVRSRLDKLEQEGYDLVWRAKGDGDCFYRSFILAYLLRILHSENPQLEANIAFSNIQSAIPLLSTAGFQVDMLEDFLEPLLAQLKSFEDGQVTEHEIISVLQESAGSQSMVVALRYFTSAHIRINQATYAPYLLDPINFMSLSAPDFCATWVEPLGKEADQVMIQSLALALHQSIRVCYLDGRGEEVRWVDFEGREGEGVNDSIKLLYRPGHYDVLAPTAVTKVGLYD